ncbi:dCMP deaminase [Kushneria sinocarnis]|uniref:dCMP deaminase n=1 Tax=Kushneria sinocarnis TaxID=595502 RepID=A0A420WUK0_9GAMM|nr:hypothetical protein [Kushneria sinocarnis]RKQ97102.1 dCMP deaminase [Kushneria sinocarnis]
MHDWHTALTSLQQYADIQSHDPHCRVGSALISPCGLIAHRDVNQFPRGIANDERWHDVDAKLDLVIHAEQAVLHGYLHDVSGWTMLITKCPCHHCAQAMIQRGISRVICPPYRVGSKWERSHRLAQEMFREAGVNYTELTQ